ncbi:hypothetical protein CVIRNUC_003582 [Coccomyxa viridis]|uniref:cGMP-dependent protein kinase n=1 Tax=Coccomyxa viridis TaxID=1274662 RepID=A0AAV1I078_9CHLO|nr:hypothetical protein CVIRNUC_003582 [Coccomyxa viridis]
MQPMLYIDGRRIPDLTKFVRTRYMGCASSKPEESLPMQVRTLRTSELTKENVRKCSLDTNSKTPFAAAAGIPVSLTDTSDLASRNAGEGLSSHNRWPLGGHDIIGAASRSRSIPLFGMTKRTSLEYRMFGAERERARLQAVVTNESVGEPVMDDSDLSTGEIDSPISGDTPWDETIWSSSPVRDHFLFADLDEDTLRGLACRCDTVAYEQGQVIVRQGDKASRYDVLYILKTGDVRIDIEIAGPETRAFTRSAPFVFGEVRSSKGQELATLQRGQLFGHRTLVTKQLRSADCVAHGEVVVLTFDYSEFPRLDNPALRGLIDFDAVMAVFKALDILEHDFASTDAVYDDVDRVQTAAGDVIARKGQTLRNIFIVRDGRICGNAVCEAGGYQYFGSLNASVCSSDIIANENTMLLVHPSISPDTQKSGALPRRAPRIEFSDLEFLQIVGVGNSGCVSLQTHRPTGMQYALKAMDKYKIKYKKQSQHIHNELHIMSSIDHPFCTAFVQAYQDNSKLYILQEWMPGGELFHHMQREDIFTEDAARFYTACVVVALEYLHSCNILYRDLKPENLLMDRSGYIKLADFGFSKLMKPGQRTYTICGTPTYQAPEIVSRVGTTAAADFWSLGILIHEMLVGSTPFEEEHAPFGRMTGNRIALPKRLSDQAQNLIKRLLIRNPHDRLGSSVGASAIINHAWFAGFDWTALRARRMPAPIVPNLVNNADTSYFEAFDCNAGRDTASSGSVQDSFDTTWTDWDWVDEPASNKS